MIAGVDSHPLGVTDAGAERDTRRKPCCRRVLVLGAHPSWCLELDGHDGDCRGVISGSPPPRNNFMPRTR